MSKNSPSPPPPPDYAAAAKAQGDANLQSGLQTAVLSNPNINSPYGNQTVTWNQDPNNPGGAPQATVNQTLTPQAQQTLDAQQRTQTALANLANQGAGNASGILATPFKYNGPDIQTSVALQGAPGSKPLDYGPRAGTYGLATGAADLSGVAKAPVNAGMTAQQAILSRLQPQIDRSNNALQSRLANQGIGLGSDAYKDAETIQGQNNNDLVTQAAAQGVGLDMAANNQGFNQALQSAGLYNSAVGQNFGQGAAAAGLYNSAAGQEYGQELQGAQFANQSALAAGQFGNTGVQQAMQQQLALRNQPLNEITALESGSQIQNPQFQQYTGATVNAAPVFQGAQAQGQAALDQYGIQQNAATAQMQALYGLAGSGVTAAIKYSDARLKTNAVRVGTHSRGFGIYEYDFAGRRERGVLAQEVERFMPEAVGRDAYGWRMVDYGLLAA